MTVKFKGPCSATPLDVYKKLRKNNPAPFASYLHYDPSRLWGPARTGTLPKVTSSAVDAFTAVVGTMPVTPKWYFLCTFICTTLLIPSVISPVTTYLASSVLNRYSIIGGISVCCSSPERYLHATVDGAIESKPIKGTVRRARDAVEDLRIARELKHDVKSRAENLMIVDLVRNDFGRVCEVGSVTVPRLMHVESYASVHQLVSTIRGQLSKTKNIVDAIIATFPGGRYTLPSPSLPLPLPLLPSPTHCHSLPLLLSWWQVCIAHWCAVLFVFVLCATPSQ